MADLLKQVQAGTLIEALRRVEFLERQGVRSSVVGLVV
jgi:hypothetical protein